MTTSNTYIENVLLSEFINKW